MSDTLAQVQAALRERYAVERELGQGGMATVYLAQDDRHDRKVAIKVLKPELASALGPERFLREIRLAAGLQHPHILSVYDSGEAQGLLYYVMPFVAGESLRDRLNREQQLPIADAVAIAREVADALASAHGQGVIHRDIKPENILLSGGHAVVADFGIARAVSRAGEERLTETGMSIGTPAYMSPEQGAGESTVDARSDIYSLGCVLYEMLCGQPPFTGPSAMAVLARHSLEAVPSLHIVRHTIPDELEDIVFRALEKVPADRFASARQFAQALAGPQTLTGATTRERVAAVPPARRRRRRQILLGLLVIPLAAGAWFGVRLLQEPDTALASGPDPNHIAVLYFEDRSGGELGHVADGLTEALIHELSEVSSLSVISSNGVRPYQGEHVPPDSLARALDVGTLVQGQLAASDDSLQLSVALINPTTGEEIGSTRLRRARGELFALQDTLAREVSAFLRERLGREIHLRQQRGETRSAGAWETLQAAMATARSADTLLAEDDAAGASRAFDRADSMMAAAGEGDRGWSEPPVQRAWLAYHRSRVALNLEPESVDVWIGRGLEHANRALEIDPKDADALEARGTLRYWRWLLNLEPDSRAAQVLYEGAESDLQASIVANPNQAQALSTLSHLLLGQGRNAEGKVMAQRAYEADPYLSNADQVLMRLFQASFDLDDLGQARHWCEVGADRFPDDSRFAGCRILVLAMQDTVTDVPAVWKLLDSYVSLAPPGEEEIARHIGGMWVAMALVRAGLPDSARAVAVRSRASPELDPTRDAALYESIVHTMIGDNDEALRQLSTYIAVNPRVRELLANDRSWYFDGLRDDPGYKALVSTGS